MRISAFILAVIAAALWAAVSVSARGQVVCAERPRLADHLLQNFRERSVGAGLTYSGQAIELFAAESGSWTIIVMTPAGEACIVSHGDAWRSTSATSPSVSGRRS